MEGALRHDVSLSHRAPRTAETRRPTAFAAAGCAAVLLSLAPACSSDASSAPSNGGGPEASPPDSAPDASAPDASAPDAVAAEATPRSDGAPASEAGGGGSDSAGAGPAFDAPPPEDSPAGALDAAPGVWTDVTPANLVGLQSMCGDLAYVASSPLEDLLIIAVASHGLYGSTHAGPFVQLGPTMDNGTGQILFDPQRPSAFWQAGNHGASCGYATADDGTTFRDLGMFTGCDTVGVDFTDPQRQTMLAGQHEGHGLFRSADSGMTWTDISSSVPSSAGNIGYVHVVSSTTYLVGTWNSQGSDGVFRSTDSGGTWTRVYQAGIRSHAFVASSGTLYWLLANQEQPNGKGGLVRSDDQGATFTLVQGSDAIVSSEKGLVELPDGSLATMGQNGVIVSADGGSTWKQVGANWPYANPTGVDYDIYRKAFYIWTYDCGQNGNTIHAGMVQAMAYATP
jgi:hypothetical protein